jgi:hypothetical protein
MTKDDLETIIDELGLVYSSGGVTGAFKRFQWIRKEEDIEKLLRRLQNHKLSLNLILTILQSSTMSQVQGCVSQLCALVEQAVSQNSALSSRLSRLEAATTIDTKETDNDDESVETVKRTTRPLLDTDVFESVPFSFDNTLWQSRVYKRLQLLQDDGHSETSITSSVRRKYAASIFSKLSLADISNLSQFSLPILIQEINHNHWYIQIGKPKATTSAEPHSKPLFDSEALDGNARALYAIVQYRFRAELPDEFDAAVGEPVLIVAYSDDDPEWVVAKTIDRLGGPGLIPLSFLEVRSVQKNTVLPLSPDTISQTGVPSVREWKLFAAECNDRHYQFGMELEEFPERRSFQTRTTQTPSLVMTTFQHATRPSTDDGKSPHSNVPSEELETLPAKCLEEYKLVVMGGRDVDKSGLVIQVSGI